MNYNDGKWHGWSGEDMKPASIHEETVIDYVWFDEEFDDNPCGVTKHRKASNNVAWSQVVKFRVIKEHKEPRNVYLKELTQYKLSTLGTSSVWVYCAKNDPCAVMFREVIE